MPDLINGGISLVIALMFFLVASGVMPISKDKEVARANLERWRWLYWLAAIATAILGVFKVFGVLR